MIRKWAMTGLGLGYAPVASGTFGSAGACAIALGAWAIIQILDVPSITLDIVWIALTLLASVGCVCWGDWAIDYFGKLARKKGDPGQVVLDEWAGQWIALVAMPMADFKQALIVLAVQFFVFRLFDVIKPPPGRRLERLHGGWGILTDDLAAGVYANIVGQVIFRLIIDMPGT